MYTFRLLCVAGIMGVVLLFGSDSADALVFKSQPVGIQVGDGGVAASAPGDNLIYGILGSSVQGSLMLLQNGSGNNRFQVDIDGNVTAYGDITAGGSSVCRADGTNCPAGTTQTLQVVTDAGSTTTNGITVANINTGIGATEVYLMNQNVRTTDSPTFASPTFTSSVDIQGSIADSGSDLIINDWVDVQWGLLNSSANNSGNVYINDNTQIIGTLNVSGVITGNGSGLSSLSSSNITTNIVSSIDGVSNDGGDIDLIAGDNITLTPDDGGNAITIAAAGGAEVDGVIGNEITSATNSTLTRSGSGTGGSPYTIGLNLSNANTWTGAQTFNAQVKVDGNLILDNVSSKPSCTSGTLGNLVFDTVNNRPYVCTSGDTWKPLDSDFDKDGITDSKDADDTNASDADATAGTVLSGSTFYSGQSSSRITGTMTNVGAQTITPSTANQTITAGYHTGGGYCAGDTDLSAGNIKNGKDIFGITGTLTPYNNSIGGASGNRICTGNVITSRAIAGHQTGNGHDACVAYCKSYRGLQDAVAALNGSDSGQPWFGATIQCAHYCSDWDGSCDQGNGSECQCYDGAMNATPKADGDRAWDITEQWSS